MCEDFSMSHVHFPTRRTNNFVVIIASNCTHHMLYTHLLMLWASHMGCTWSESCVVAFAVLLLSRSFYVTLRRAWHFWLTFGASDHLTCQLGLSYIIPEIGGGAGGGRGGSFKTSRRILENLDNFRAIWTSTRHFTGKNADKTFLPTDQERTQSAHILQQCLGYWAQANQRFFITIIYTITYRRLFLKRGPRYPKKSFF